MGLRMRRSFKVASGVRLNMSKSGFSTSTKLGPVTLNSRGRATVRVAKGVSYSTSTRTGQRRASSHAARSTTVVPIEPQVVAVPHPRPKSGAATFVLWLLIGLIGGHRYYLGKTKTAVLQTLTLGGLGVWWLFDLLLLPSLVHQRNRMLVPVTAVVAAGTEPGAVVGGKRMPTAAPVCARGGEPATPTGYFCEQCGYNYRR